MIQPNKTQIFQDIKQLLFVRELRSKQRKDLINYYKLIKDDVDFIEEAKKQDLYYWLFSLEEAYSVCSKQYHESADIDRETEKLMIVLNERLLEESYELIKPFKIKEYTKFFDDLSQKSLSMKTDLNVSLLKNILKFKYLSIVLIPVVFAIISILAFWYLAVAFKIDISSAKDSAFFVILFGGIVAIALFILTVFLDSKKSAFFNKVLFKSEDIYQQQINSFVQLYRQLTQEDVIVNRHSSSSRYRTHAIPLAKFLKEILPENISVLLPFGEEQSLRIIISMGLDNDVAKRISFGPSSALVNWLTSSISDIKMLVKSTYDPTLTKSAQTKDIKEEMDSIKAEVLVPMYEWVSKNKRVLIGALSFGPKLYGKYTEADLDDLFWLGRGFSTIRKDREIIEKIKKDLVSAIETSYSLKQEPKIIEDLKKKLLIFEAERIIIHDTALNRKQR